MGSSIGMLKKGGASHGIHGTHAIEVPVATYVLDGFWLGCGALCNSEKLSGFIQRIKY